MSAVKDFERRMALSEARVDLDEDRKIRGLAIVFDSKSVDLGGFREIIKPEAVDRALRENADVRALVDHDSSKVIGRTRAGTLELRKDRKGLRVTIDPPNTTYAKDIMESLRRGDVSGMSFGFRVLSDDWRMEDGEAIREVSDIELHEVSLVSFPAYQATSAEVAQRSYRSFLEQQRPSPTVEYLRKKAMVRRARG